VGPRLRLATVFHLGPSMRRSLADAVALEAAGIDMIGVPEAYGVDAVSLLGYLAGRTERVTLATTILPIYSRTPTLIAMTAAGLDDVSDGRFILGLGASGPQVIEGWHGVGYDAPLGRTREIVEICRSVWRRERLVHQGRHYQIPLPAGVGTDLGKPLKLITPPLRSRIPIYLAALGDKNIALTAEIADGWLPFMFVPERADGVWGDALARGRERRAVDLGPLQISAGGPFAITGSADEALRLRGLGRPRLALYIGGMGSVRSNFYNDLVRRYGFADAAHEVQRRYLGGDKPGAEQAVPFELVEGTSLIGDESYLRDRLQAYVAAGVTTVQVTPVGPEPIADIRRLRELVEDL
jgi:F420-dependent oxidoreductase-like protein